MAFFDSMDRGGGGGEPGSGVYHATLNFDEIEKALAIPAALRRGSSAFSPKKAPNLAIRHPPAAMRQPHYGAAAAAAAAAAASPEPNRAQHNGGGASGSPEPHANATRSVGGVHLPSWAVVQPVSRAPSVEPADDLLSGFAAQPAASRFAAPSLAAASGAAAAAQEDPGAAYMRQFQHYQQEQQAQARQFADQQQQFQQQQPQQRQAEQQYRQEQQRQQQQQQQQQPQQQQPQPQQQRPQQRNPYQWAGRDADDEHGQLMDFAAAQPARPRSGAAGALGYTAKGPFAAGGVGGAAVGGAFCGGTTEDGGAGVGAAAAIDDVVISADVVCVT
jgi:hypothetical protein